MHTKINSIKQIEIELSSYCNASCPLCSRNFYGYNYKNPSYGFRHLSLNDIKKIFNQDNIVTVDRIILQGNFGDFAMNPETPEIVDYLLLIKPSLKIIGHTNGSVQSQKWWASLSGITVNFALDGKDQKTHELYRKDTSFEKIIRNATALKNAGGKVIWKMIIFDHNQNQISECQKMAADLGFDFNVIENIKTFGPVFNQQKIFLHEIGNWKGSRDLDSMLNDTLVLEDIQTLDNSDDPINCLHLKENSLYISSYGEVFPCCFMAHAPDRWNHGRWIQIFNEQLKPLISDNNCLEKDLDQSMQWFERIPDTWNITKFSKGRLLYCHNSCSKKKI